MIREFQGNGHANRWRSAAAWSIHPITDVNGIECPKQIAQPQDKGDDSENVKNLPYSSVHGNVIVGHPEQKSDKD